MKRKEHAMRILSLLLALIMVIGLMPTGAAAAEAPIVLIAGGDYQQAGDHANSSANITNILKRITAAGFTAVDGFLFVGDYDCETHDSSSETAAGISSLMSTVQGVYSNLNTGNTILVQGNHDYPDSRIDSSGGHTFDGYSVFVMNEDDYPNYGGSASQAQTLSAKLDSFLAEKLNAGYTAPIFVTSHVPLHFGPRTNRQGDGKYASYYFDVLNAYGAEGLNIIFMHGHNHAYGYDEYVGGEAIYLAVGDKINIAKTGSQSSYDTHTLNFTYMNAGYTGYYNESGYSTSSGTDFLTMTTFQIYSDRVVINRFNEKGLYNMKSAGQLKGDYINSVSVSANTSVYASSQTVTLKAPVARVTLKDAASGVTVTGRKVDGTFDDNTDLVVTANRNVNVLNDTAVYAAYEAYTTSFTADGDVVVTLPVPNSYAEKATKVFYVEGNNLTAVDASISTVSGQKLATFTTSQDGTYAVAQEVVYVDSVYYERVDSVDALESGEQYLIVFDCSSQTTADAIVMPTIATHSSGSSKRMGPDVLVSDGLGDEDTITGDYDAYLWTLTKSGSGWLIGNGSQNINVTYSSTTSRCELAFTASGEALTIAKASSNPSDADSNSFAIYDSSKYYWQYNTSATLIYGTNGDSYSSRFHFYKRVENTATAPDVSVDWVTITDVGTYTLDTDGITPGADNKYIIVGSNSNYALTLSGTTVGAAKVTVSGNTLTLDNPSAYEFYFADNSGKESGTYLLTRDGTKTVYHSGGNMYYGSDNKGYWQVTSVGGGSYQISDFDNLNWYLNYGYVWASDAVSRFAVSSSTRTVRLFTCATTYARLAGQQEQTYAATDKVTEQTVLNNIYIQTTNASRDSYGTVAVTPGMVSWNAAFDGATAGTYTGTVYYEGYNMGSVTVTVTPAEHTYEAVITAPTCTAGGYTTYTCTECGDSYIADETAALGHRNETVTVAATCTEAGSVTTTCAVCGESTLEIIEALGHSYETVTVNATCTEAGSVTTTCTACGDTTVEAIEALGHSYEAATTEATCTQDGTITYYCAACGDIYSETIPAKGHSYQTVVTAPTCTAAGYTTHTCTGCGHSYTTDETNALGHRNETVTVAATCTQGGYTKDTCSVCGTSSIYNETAPLGHIYQSVTVDPTETEGGYTTHTCATCGHSYTDSCVDALGHSYVSVVTPATCETDGYTTHTCATCGDVIVDTYVRAPGHNYETVTVAATCETDGYTESTCSVCGDHQHTVLKALGHSYSAAVTAPTCTESGYTVYTCATCGHSYTGSTTAALGHDYTAVTTDATCTESGFVTHICQNCGDSYLGETISPLGHSYQTVTVAATCEKDGSVTHTCTACGHSYVSQTLAALGHNYTAVTTAPTCTANGATVYTCGRCSHSYSETISATGHSYRSVVTAPTCTANGYTTHTCTACGSSYVSNTTQATGHSYSCVESNGSLIYTCAGCGHSYTESLAHTYTKVTSIGSGNNYVITLVSGSKYYALSHANNRISVIQVTVSNNKITSEITKDLVWTYNSSKLSYEENGTTYYLYASSGNSWWGNWFGSTTLTLSTTNSSTVSFSSNRLKIGSKYLRYSNGSATLSSSRSTTYFFVED